MAASHELVASLSSKRQRRMMLLQKLNHAIPAVGLFFAGQQAIREGHPGFGFYLGVFELVSSAALIIFFVRELRSAVRPKHSGHSEHHGVDWVDIAAGFVLSAEVLEHWHLKHHWPRPIILSAITAFALGLFHGRLMAKRAGRRVLRVTRDGLSIAGRPFKARRLHATWEELSAVEVGARWAVVTTHAGRSRKLDLADLEDEARVRAALVEAQQRLASDRSSSPDLEVRPTSNIASRLSEDRPPAGR